MDKIRITILADGTIKTDTDTVSLPNHANAEGFVREMSRLAGGTTEIKAKHGHTHTHHGHTHTH